MVQLPTIPILEDYDISSKTGFLPETPPLQCLTDPYYEPWESIVNKLPSLIMSDQLSTQVDSLPWLSVSKLNHDPREYQRAYTVLGFIISSYVWSGEISPRGYVPKQLADPLLKVSKFLDLPPIATYAGVCLWNFKPLFDNDMWSLNSLTTINTFTGGIDESWFYLISIVIEKKGSGCLNHGLEAIHACREQNPEKVMSELQKLAAAIDELRMELLKMEKMCDPYIFYFRLRPFLRGWKNMENEGLPNGVEYETEYENEVKYLAGGNNAQSSLIQSIDIILGIKHYDTTHIHEMREYMPKPHKTFLIDLENVACIHQYVSNLDNPSLSSTYDTCLAMMRAFRDTHIEIVTKYIITQSKKKGGSTSQQQQRGSGGTLLIPFLTKVRDETTQTAVTSWAKNMITDTKQMKKINGHIY